MSQIKPHKFNSIQLNAVLIGKKKGTITSHSGFVINHYVYDPSWLSILPIPDQQNDKNILYNNQLTGNWLSFSNVDGLQYKKIMVFIPDATRANNQKFSTMEDTNRFNLNQLEIGQKIILVLKKTIDSIVTFKNAHKECVEVEIKRIIPINQFFWEEYGQYAIVLNEYHQRKKYFWCRIDERFFDLLDVSSEVSFAISNGYNQQEEQNKMLVFADINNSKKTVRTTDLKLINRFLSIHDAEKEIKRLKKLDTGLLKKNEKIYTTNFKNDGLFDRLNFKEDSKFNHGYRLEVIDLSTFKFVNNYHDSFLNDVYEIPDIERMYQRLVYYKTQIKFGIGAFNLVNLDKPMQSIIESDDQYGLEGLIDLLRTSRPSTVSHIKPLLRSTDSLEEKEANLQKKYEKRKN